MAEAENSGKACKRCGEIKPRSEFSPHSGTKDKLRPECKPCRVAGAKAYRAANPGKRSEQDRRTRQKHHAKYLAREAAYRAAKREQENGRYRQWRADNSEHRRAYEAEWRKKNRDDIRKGWCDWRARNVERVRRASRAWDKAHPEHCRAKDLRRRARLRGAGGRVGHAELKIALERQGGRCWWCGCKVGRKYHADHVTPLARGGSGGIENIVVSCAPCNWRKGAKTPAEFAGRLF